MTVIGTTFIVLVLTFGWTWALIGFIGACAWSAQRNPRVYRRYRAQIIRFPRRGGGRWQ